MPPRQRNRLPSGLRLVNDKPGRVIAFDDNDTSARQRKIGVGMLSWNDEGTISWVQIYDDEYKRRGIANAMFDYARENVRPDIKHSSDLSESGRAWAEAEAVRDSGVPGEASRSGARSSMS